MQNVTQEWKEKLGMKTAAAQQRDRQEIDDAFAQQAYQAVANRDKAIMKDPHLLGFETIEHNEDNTRLLGAFAFRVNSEILLVPIFFLNGQIKGHQMIHRKGVKRFYPNSEKWVAYFLAGEQDSPGRPIERAGRQGRIHFPLDRLSGKMASNAVWGADIDAEIEEAMSEVKEASAEQWDTWEKEAEEFAKEASGRGKVMTSIMDALSKFRAGAASRGGALLDGAKLHGGAAWNSPVVTAVRKNPGKTTLAAGGVAGAGLGTAELTGLTDLNNSEGEEALAAQKAEAANLEKAIADESAAIDGDKGILPNVADGFKSLVDTDRIKEYATNPYVMGALALGIPTTAILASRWNKKRKEEKEKGASVDNTPAEPWIVKHLWKEAMEEWEVTTPGHIFADAMVGAGMQKQAASLAARCPQFAEWIHMAGLLDHAKEASAPVDPEPVLTYFNSSPPVGFGDELVQEFYKRGYAIYDQRTEKEVRDRIVEEDPEVTLSGHGAAGMRTLLTREGPVKALWGPVGDTPGHDYPHNPYDPSPRSGNPQRYCLVAMEGKNKGCYAEFESGGSAHDDAEYPLFQDGIKSEKCEEGKKPVAGGIYMLWCDGRFINRNPIKVRSIRKTADGTAINMDPGEGESIMIHPELEGTELQGRVRYVGENVCFIKLTPEKKGDSWPKRMPVCWFTRSTIQDALIGKTHKIKFARQGRLFELQINGKVAGQDLTESQMAIKMATAGRMSVEDIHDVIDNDIREFSLVDPTFGKEASAYYDRDIDFDAEFGGDESFDEDLLTRLLPAVQNARVVAIRHQQPSAERHYLDARGYGGARNADHVSDEQLLGMTDPARQLAEIGQQTGMNSLIDHGALSALTKVFDAGPYIKEYVGKLEESLDYLARLLFMLFWKPKDFNKMFGEDDLVSLENKLLGVFEAYGDLVLELLQSTGDKDHE